MLLYIYLDEIELQNLYYILVHPEVLVVRVVTALQILDSVKGLLERLFQKFCG